MGFSMRKNSFFILGMLFRLTFLFISDYIDRLDLKAQYTDIDYLVFTDGAKYVLEGGSPYDRHTYRYTPLLAYLVMPSIYWFGFGKLIFVLSDLLTAHYLGLILKLSTRLSEEHIDNLLALWIFNPFAINISTRGSADTLIGLMIVIAIYYLLKGKILKAGLIFGFAAHFKIYPLLYALPMYFYIDRGTKKLVTQKRFTFFVSSATIFILLFVFFFGIYGHTFAYEGFFYHLIRKDHRHSFSLFFYYIYLNFADIPIWLSIGAFLPQIILLIAIGYKFYPDLPFCIFVQTFVFVMYNKVSTAQYFVWYLVLLPLVLANNNLIQRKNWWKLISLFILWITVLMIWNWFAFLLEIEGHNMFFEIFAACIALFLVNFVTIVIIIGNQNIQEFRIITSE